MNAYVTDSARAEEEEVITDTHFLLDIQMSNAAMQTAEDVAQALRELADRLDAQSAESGKILDINGQSVGTWEYKDLPREQESAEDIAGRVVWESYDGDNSGHETEEEILTEQIADLALDADAILALIIRAVRVARGEV